MIKDKIKYFNKENNSELKCCICYESGHEFVNCYKSFFVPNKKYIIKNHL